MKINKLSHAEKYLHSVGLLEVLNAFKSPADDLVESLVTPSLTSGPISIDLIDLARLHLLVTARKCLNVLELGSGFSSLVIAHAISMNSKNANAILPSNLRRENPWQLDSVDESEVWLEVTKSRIPSQLNSFVNFYHRKVVLSSFNDRPATYYQDLPNRAYDFIYIDGPSQYAVADSDRLGFSTSNPGRMPMSADVLRIEHFLQSGTLVLFDGRTANSVFFETNTQKNWKKIRSRKFDQTLFIDKSNVLGKHNEAFLNFWGKVTF